MERIDSDQLNKLAVKAKTCEESRDKLVRKLWWYIRSIAYDICGQSDDVDDLASEGLIAVLDCVNGYAESKGSFMTYIRKHVRGKMIDFVKMQFTTFYNHISNHDAIDTVFVGSVGRSTEKITSSIMVDSLLEILDVFERSVIERYFIQGVPVSDMAADHGLSRDQIYRVIDASLYKMRLKIIESEMDTSARGTIAEMGRMFSEGHYDKAVYGFCCQGGAVLCQRQWKSKGDQQL